MNSDNSSAFYLGTVTDVDNNGVKFILDGHSSALEKRYKQLNTGNILTVGDRVVIMKMSGTYIVMGKISYDNEGGSGEGAPASTTIPLPDGVANTGAENAYARGDHVHPISSNVIPYGKLSNTSTETSFKATIDGVTELKNGLCIILRNGVVNSSSGCTLNVNNLGAKPMYIMNASGGRVTNHWSSQKTALLIYNTVRIAAGCWDFAELWDTNSTYNLASFGMGTGYCNTEESDLDKFVNWSGFVRNSGASFLCYFKNAVPTGSTLKVGYTTSEACQLYINVPGTYNGTTGSEYRAIQTGDILAGDCCLIRIFYKNSNYQYVVMAIDRYWLPAS